MRIYDSENNVGKISVVVHLLHSPHGRNLFFSMEYNRQNSL
ncbi:MAG: hypothetical protein BROFUL_02607 [Candidatus Brocadia fulgida]|jgi:hypothetical protein|uniref:Uncharacterized protein n=1 Tax=Candidatus Brocadia fulgida TaxID=380242 RepID=A0A0M2UUJ8_9BACT|nr:MAG: hypothetical protein BROFUL_02607 [Candidatus Brocadia fulgida]